MTNAWSVAGSTSYELEFRFLEPGGQIVFNRKCDVKNPRTRIWGRMTLARHFVRGDLWDAERGTHADKSNLGYTSDLSPSNTVLSTNTWYQARVVQREKTSALLVNWEGAWREIGFIPYRWSTEETYVETMPGRSEVRNVKPMPETGPARLRELAADGVHDLVVECAPGWGRALVKVACKDGTDYRMYVLTSSAKPYLTVKDEKGREKWHQRDHRHAALRLTDPPLSVATSPVANMFRPSERAAVIDEHEAHPGNFAPFHRVKLRFGADDSVWLNGRYQGVMTNGIAGVSLYVPEVAPAGEKLEAVTAKPNGKTLSLDPSDCAGVKRTDDGRAYLDISEHVCHADFGQETDRYFSRNGLDGLKDSFVWSVPNRCWQTARIVAAVKPDKAENSVPIATVRLVRNSYAGYGNACAEGQVDLERAPRMPAGETTIGGRKVPLYSYTVRIPVGDIQDRLYVKRGAAKFGKAPYLDVDILGPLGKPGVLWDSSHRPAWKKISSALVFACELVESPCEMELLQSQPGLVFGDDEKRETTVRVKANEAGSYVLCGTIRDWWEKEVRSWSEKLELESGEERLVPIDLKVPEEGWYEMSLDLREDGRAGRATLPGEDNSVAHHSSLITHRCSFADVGRDTRKAGYESPYCWWWHGRFHEGTADIDVMGPLFRKAGVRRISAGDGDQTEESMKKYGMTLSQIPFNIQLAMGPKPLDQKVKEYEAWLRKILRDFPHVERRALVFHESYCGGDAGYLFGKPYKELPESAFGEAKKRYEIGTALCRMIREKFPEIRIQLGNSSTSYEILDMMFRLKFPSEFFDLLGSETVARFTLPDLPVGSSGPNSLWFLNRVADRYGYRQRADVCYEWACHLPRELGWKDTVEWGLRDRLLGFANGATVMPAAGCTPDDSYYNSDYGGISTVDRYPYLYPTRSYVALAMMTKELDCATFARKLETGSQTVTALEFRRAGGECVYALWLPRGRATVKAVGAEPSRIVRADAKRLTELALSTLPVFATTPRAVERFEIVSRETPGAVEPRNFQLADALTEAASVEALVITNRPEKAYFAEKSPFVHGRYSVRQGEGCVELVRDASLPAPAKLVPELGYFAFKNPIALKGEPASVSVEVDGNSSWAELVFVFEDAAGTRHYETGIAYEGDGKGLRRVNFDGWGTMQMPLTNKSRVRSSEVAPGGDDWRTSVHGRKHEDLVYPVKIVGLAVLMPRDTLTGGCYEPVSKDPNVLRVRNLGVFE